MGIHLNLFKALLQGSMKIFIMYTNPDGLLFVTYSGKMLLVLI